MKKRKGFIKIFFCFLAALFLASCSSEESGEPSEEWVEWKARQEERSRNGIPETVLDESQVLSGGIYVGELYIGERTVAEARQLLESDKTDSGAMEVVVFWQDQEEKTTSGELGLHWDIDELLKRAVRYGQLGGPLRQYRDQKDLAIGTLHLEVVKSLDEETLSDFVTGLAAKRDVAPVNATIDFTGELKVSESKTGLATNQEETKAAIRAAVLEAYGNITVDAVVDVAEPKYSTELLQQIKDNMGSHVTQYHKEGNPRKERDTNVEVATKNIDGTIVLPGESVSVSELMKPRTEENGYRTGSQYENGQVVDAIGGGVCQVSSTLYNALLKAEIQIDERYPHSMVVSYLTPGRDAAIADGHKDLVFTNDKDVPLYIWGVADGNEVSFIVFGKKDTPENRTVSFEVEELYRKESEIEVKYDSSKPTGYEDYEGTNSPELDVALWKIIKIDGEENERIKMHTDHYEPSIQTHIIGTGG